MLSASLQVLFKISINMMHTTESVIFVNGSQFVKVT